jgi:hypothetical protein
LERPGFATKPLGYCLIWAFNQEGWFSIQGKQRKDTHPQDSSEPAFGLFEIIVYDLVGESFLQRTVFLVGTVGVRHGNPSRYTAGLRLAQKL